MIPTAMILSFFFFGIEEIAIQLEEPFSVLPQKQMTENIFLSVNEYVKWHSIEKERAANTRVSYETLPLKGMPGSDMLNRMSGNELGVPDYDVIGSAKSLQSAALPVYTNGSTEAETHDIDGHVNGASKAEAVEVEPSSNVAVSPFVKRFSSFFQKKSSPN